MGKVKIGKMGMMNNNGGQSGRVLTKAKEEGEGGGGVRGEEKRTDDQMRRSIISLRLSICLVCTLFSGLLRLFCFSNHQREEEKVQRKKGRADKD